jgi:hypothetical protein
MLSPKNREIVDRLDISGIGRTYVDIEPADLDALMDLARSQGRIEALKDALKEQVRAQGRRGNPAREDDVAARRKP